MKKHNEGYALVLVLVVITVLSLVAMAMMAGSLRNLQNQQKSIERMEAKYTAQGEIEKEIAKLNGLISEDGSTSSIKASDLSDLFGTALKLKTSKTSETTEDSDKLLYFDQYYLLTLRAEKTVKEKKVTAECKIRITGSMELVNEELVLRNPKWEYVSYTITEGGGS